METFSEFAPLLGYSVSPGQIKRSPTPEEEARERERWVVPEWHDRAVFLPYKSLRRHCAIFGGTDTGKTRFALNLFRLGLHSGFSAVLIDPKEATIKRALALCEWASVPPEAVTLITPRRLAGGTVPGWNPLSSGNESIGPRQLAGAFVSLLHDLYGSSWGPQMQNLLKRGAQLAAAHGLTPFELARLLTNDAYRAQLLAAEPEHRDAGYGLVLDFFTEEFAVWDSSKRRGAISPVTNKLGDFIDSDFYRALFCPRQNTLDLDSLWQKQQVVLVHLDAAETDATGAALLGGLFSSQLLRIAMKKPGNVPVLLFVDELGVQGKFVGESLAQIVAIAREQGLHLVLASQHPDQLSRELRDAVRRTMAVRVYFKLGDEDANRLAKDLERAYPDDLAYEEWYPLLRNLPNRHAVVTVDGSQPKLIRCVRCDVEEPSEQYTRAVCAKNQSREEAAAAYAWRRSLIEQAAAQPAPPARTRLARPLKDQEVPLPDEEEQGIADDGSLL